MMSLAFFTSMTVVLFMVWSWAIYSSASLSMPDIESDLTTL